MYTFKNLEEMYDYYLTLEKDPTVKKNNFYIMPDKKDLDKLGNLNNIYNRFYQYMVNYCGYNELPKVMSDKKYLEFDSPEVYHGFTKFSHPVTLLSHWNYHYGQGITPGFYTTNSSEHAKRYTVEDEFMWFTNKDKVMKLKLDTKNAIDYNEIVDIVNILKNGNFENDSVTEKYSHVLPQLKVLRDFANGKVQEEKKLEHAKGFLDMFLVKSTLAVFLGFDTIIYKNPDQNLTYIIELDRSKIILSNSEAQRFMKKSSKAKNVPLNILSDEEADEIINDSCSQRQ